SPGSGVARRLPFADTVEERLKGSVQPGQYVLQDKRVDVAIVGSRLFDAGKLCALAGEGDAHTALLPGVAAFLRSGVVAFAAAAHDKRHCPRLFRRGPDLALEGLADRPLVHSGLCCLIGAKTAARKGHSSAT